MGVMQLAADGCTAVIRLPISLGGNGWLFLAYASAFQCQ